MPPTLSPEHKRFLDVFSFQYQFYNRASMIFVVDLTLDDVTIEDTRMFVHGKVGRRNLPHPLGWVWNQSKSKVTVQFSSSESLVITKWNPRKTQSAFGNSRPAYKLWVCGVHSPKTKGTNLHFIWVEKGRETLYSIPSLMKEIDFYTEERTDKEIALKDLYFLKDFIEPHLAIEFGWSSKS